MTAVTNGVNVQALLDAREVLKGAPEAAQFTWRASAKWQSGVHSTIKVQSFFGLGEEQNHKEEWTFEADGRHRVRRGEPRYPAALGRVHGRGWP